MSRWTHSWRMNQLFYNLFNPKENFSRGICLLTSWACKTGIWSTLAQLDLIRQILLAMLYRKLFSTITHTLIQQPNICTLRTLCQRKKRTMFSKYYYKPSKNILSSSRSLSCKFHLTRCLSEVWFPNARTATMRYFKPSCLCLSFFFFFLINLEHLWLHEWRPHDGNVYLLI